MFNRDTYKTKDLLFIEWADKNNFTFVSNTHNTHSTKRVLSTIIYQKKSETFPTLFMLDTMFRIIIVNNMPYDVCKKYFDITAEGRCKKYSWEYTKHNNKITISTKYFKVFKEIVRKTELDIGKYNRKYWRKFKITPEDN